MLDANSDIVSFLRNQQTGPNAYPGKGDRAKYMELPSAVYSMHPYDQVLKDGKRVGLSTWIGYSANEGRMLTLAMLDAEFAEPGTEVTLLWGGPDGGTKKPTVERHVQTEIKAVVASVPYSEVARDAYAESWRTRQEALAGRARGLSRAPYRHPGLDPGSSFSLVSSLGGERDPGSRAG